LKAWLLDTNIVSLVAPARRRSPAEDELAAWIAAHSDSLFLSVITAAEIENGIARAARGGATARAARLA
jgi:predicted nucleic acid-binding protein